MRIIEFILKKKMNILRWMWAMHLLSQCHTQKIYRTISNATQFYALENLIGSIHSDSSIDTQTYVIDAGLTRSQRRLLSLYRNVTVIPIASLSSNDSYLSITNRLQMSRHDKQSIYRIRSIPIWVQEWPHIDAIRKRLRLAIVIPLIHSQLSSLVIQFNRSEIYQPCRSKKNDIDLIIYHNEKSQSPIELKIQQIIHDFRSLIQSCYGRVRIFAADLVGSNDTYAMGSAIMWKKLIDDSDALSLRSFGYTHFFLMETDTMPIQSFWLDAIYDQIIEQRSDPYFSTSWWILGSLYRGTKTIGSNYAHINGNALYLPSPLNFVLFVKFFWTFYEQASPQGYDYALHGLFHRDEAKPMSIWKFIAHRFRYSDFIQNRWHDDIYINHSYFVMQYPQTFLIHVGSHWFEKSITENSTVPIPKTMLTHILDLFSPLVFIELIVMFFILLSVLTCSLIHPYWRYYLHTQQFQLLRLLLYRRKCHQ